MRCHFRCSRAHHPAHKKKAEYQRGEKAKQAHRFKTGLRHNALRGNTGNPRHICPEALRWGLVRHSLVLVSSALLQHRNAAGERAR